MPFFLDDGLGLVQGLRLDDRGCPTLSSIEVFDAFEIDVVVIRSPMLVSRSPITVSIYADLDLF